MQAQAQNPLNVHQFVIVVSYSDRSGIIQCLGPYRTEMEAEAASAQLQAWPLFEAVGGLWEVKPQTLIIPGRSLPDNQD